MLTTKQLKTMLDMQNKMNKTIHPEWFKQDWNYYRASYLEAAEAVEHHGWKWWKAQKKDLPQLQMELIDIWHFYLSRFLQANCGDENLALQSIEISIKSQIDTVNFDNHSYNVNTLSTLEKLDLLIGLNASQRIEFKLFFALMKDCELTFSDLNKQYVMKNILNIFRQKNGYKEGTYHKTWFDAEDNVTLVHESSLLNSNDDDYADKLWNNLEQKYQESLIFLANKK